MFLIKESNAAGHDDSIVHKIFSFTQQAAAVYKQAKGLKQDERIEKVKFLHEKKKILKFERKSSERNELCLPRGLFSLSKTSKCYGETIQ